MPFDLRVFFNQVTGAAAAVLMIVLAIAFLATPFTLERTPGHSYDGGAGAAPRHMT